MTSRATEQTREILSDFAEHAPALGELYRDLHAHPEPGWQEQRTAGVVAARLHAAGYKVVEGVGGTGVVGELRNGDGPVVLVRADMDALPVTERTGLPYASTIDGVMHACGHDMHVACLTGTAEALARARSRWSGTLLVVGQPAEELGEGAAAMVRDPAWAGFARPDVVLGQHVGPFPAGAIVHRPGLIMSAATTVDVRLFGRGGHGSAPERCVDPIVIAAHLITRLQTIVSREVSPRESVVVTAGQVHAGTAANVIPDEARVSLNFRVQSERAREQVLSAIRRIAEAECAAAGAPRPPEFTVSSEFPLTLNDADADARVSSVHTELFGAEAVLEHGPMMGSEDFSVFGDAEHNGGTAVPTNFWFFGGTSWDDWNRAAGETPEEKLADLPGNHSALFAPDPDPTIQVGTTALTAAALAYLA
ncbi:amidohydrolase [Actinomadura sediminis]|uniref:Amidohydrolase n=1 Tax=Actinomadura sediminis TaxID=1038904 RepID=A0ABW3EIC1_9ACTN